MLPFHSQQQQQQSLPPTNSHPSLGAAYSHPSALPQIQEWLRPGSGNSVNANISSPSATSASNSVNNGTATSSPSLGSVGPSSRAPSAASQHPSSETIKPEMSSPGLKPKRTESGSSINGLDNGSGDEKRVIKNSPGSSPLGSPGPEQSR